MLEFLKNKTKRSEFVINYFEFKNRVKELGFVADHCFKVTNVSHPKSTKIILQVSNIEECNVNTMFDDFTNLNLSTKQSLLMLATELASTPLRDRKRTFHLRLSKKFCINLDKSYLTMNPSRYIWGSEFKTDKDYYFGEKDGDNSVFTDVDISKLPRKIVDMINSGDLIKEYSI